jgi:hypothetical protein
MAEVESPRGSSGRGVRKLLEKTFPACEHRPILRLPASDSILFIHLLSDVCDCENVTVCDRNHTFAFFDRGYPDGRSKDRALPVGQLSISCRPRSHSEKMPGENHHANELDNAGPFGVAWVEAIWHIWREGVQNATLSNDSSHSQSWQQRMMRKQLAGVWDTLESRRTGMSNLTAHRRIGASFWP